jgi:hypothetical protein
VPITELFNRLVIEPDMDISLQTELF